MTKITIDRADAVNLARNIVATDSDDITQKGVRILCDAVLRMDAALAQPEQVAGVPCWCTTCRPITMDDMRFVVCPDCGNKRCPKAHNHELACTGSNEPGQPGSSYPKVDWKAPVSEPAEPQGEQESIKCVVTDNEHPNGIPYEQWVTHPSAAMKPLTEDRLNAAAKKLAALMDYPWEHMPEQGHQTMRKHVIDIIAASRGIGVQQEGE